jgi:ATP-binding protein involved in chromosome partitioning
MSHDAPVIPMSGNQPQAHPNQTGSVDSRAADRLQRRVRIINNMKLIKHKFIVASGKGGVGKSTVATNLAASLAAKGHTVGLLDMDLTGPNIPTMLGMQGAGIQEGEDGFLAPVPVPGTENLRVVSMQFLLQDQDQAIVWRGPIKMQVIGQFLGDVAWGEMDYLVVDLPPGSSDEPLSVAQNIPDADGMILVTTPQEVAIGDVRRSVHFAKKLEMPILGVIENMSGMLVTGVTAPGGTVELDNGLTKVKATADDKGQFTAVLDLFSPGGGASMAGAFGIPFLGSIPLDPRVGLAGDSGTPFVLREGPSHSKDAFDHIVGELIKE